MIKFRYIYVLIALLFSVASCQHDELESLRIPDTTNKAPEGYVALPVDMSSLNFTEQELTTRAGLELVATSRELDLKNMKAYVFDNQTPILENKLIEIQDVIRDYDANGVAVYYTVLMERTTPVRIIGVANASTEKLEELLGSEKNGVVTAGVVTLDAYGQVELKGDDSDFTYEDFLYFAQMEYNPASSNQVLKNSDLGLLPIYSESITFDELNSDVLEHWERDNSLVSRFAYARVDVVLNDGKSDKSSPFYTQLLGVCALEAPTVPADPITGLPSSSARVHTHEVTPSTNLMPLALSNLTLGKLPSSITKDNIDSKYIQGLYIYPTAPLKNSPADINDLVEDNKPVYLIVRINVGTANERFFKLIMRYTRQNYEAGETPDKGETFFLYNNNRYLVNITKINSPGYLSYNEAVQGPPSNVEYNITVDDIASNIVSNGQYYLGVNKDSFELEMTTYNSNLLYSEYIYTVGSANDISWKVNNAEQVTTVDFSLSYNGGTTDGLIGAHPDDLDAYSKVDPSLLNCTIVASQGVEYTYVDGTGIKLVAKEDLAGNTVYEEVKIPLVGADNPNASASDTIANWNDYFGIHNFRVTIPYNVPQSKITVKVGELTREIVFNVKKTMITDYSNQAFINKLLTGDESVLPITSVANSYILNPYSGASNEYYIPVVARINDFWGNYAQSKQPNMMPTDDWTNNSDWLVEPSWFDGASLAPYTVTKAQSPSGENAIKITFNGADVLNSHQNFAINVKKSGAVVWTWHLWVTNYNPYSTNANSRPVVGSGQFETIPVQNGAIHRYGEAKWTTQLAGRAMMDRNLGARNTSFASGEHGAGAGTLYYQYGRKDPFPGIVGKHASGANFATNGAYDTIPTVDALEDAVKQPTKFVTGATVSGKNWCTQIDVLQYLWHDYKASTSNLRKSIFDPSPLGWMVAPGIAFTHLDYSGWEPRIGEYEWILAGEPGLKHSYSVGGTTLFETYFPAAGMISVFSNAKLKNKTEGLSEWNTHLWTSEPSGATTGSEVDQAKSFIAAEKIRFYPWGPVTAIESDKPALAPSSRANALPVRSIQEGVY